MDRYMVTSTPRARAPKVAMIPTQDDDLASALEIVTPAPSPIRSPSRSPCRSPSHSPAKRPPGEALMPAPLSPTKRKEQRQRVFQSRLTVESSIIATSHGYGGHVLFTDPVEGRAAVAINDVVLLWTAQQGVREIKFSMAKSWITSLALSGGILIIGFASSDLYIVDHAASLIIGRFPIAHGYLTCVTPIYARPDMYAYGTVQGYIGILNVKVVARRAQAQQMFVEKLHPESVRQVISNHVGIVATASRDGTVFVLSGPSAITPKVASVAATQGVADVDFCPWAPYLLAVAEIGSRTIRVWNTITGALVHKTSTPRRPRYIRWLGRWEMFVSMSDSSFNNGSSKRTSTILGEVYSLQESRFISAFNSTTGSKATGIGWLSAGFAVLTSEHKLYYLTWRTAPSPKSLGEIRNDPAMSESANSLR